MVDNQLLRMALVGYEAQRADLLKKVAALQKQLGSASSSAVSLDAARKPRRKLSAAARKRIAAAQKKRWANWKAAQKKA